MVEPEKKVPVIYDVDVAVAGGGVSGVFAAIAAARNGAETVLIDRFGSPGGNMGPGMIAGGTFNPYQIDPKSKRLIRSVFRGLAGIPKEFVERLASLGGGSVPPYRRSHYLRDSNVASYMALKMLEETGVKLLLSTYIADPLMEGNKVSGVFVENKSGRQAVKAKVVIDATGEADVARGAGGPVLYPKARYHEVDGHAPTGMGIYFVVGDVDWDKYDAHKEKQKPKDEDLNWARETIGHIPPAHLVPLIRKAWESGEYKIVQEMEGVGKVAFHYDIGMISRGEKLAGKMFNLMTPRADLATQGKIDAGDGQQVSKLEASVRAYIFEIAQFYKRYVPGFENSYLLLISPFLGSRGGPCIEGEYTLTMDDCKVGRRFPDVIYMYGEWRALHYTCSQGECKWVDLPYRVMIPKNIDGLLAVGRSASGIPDTLLRNRMAVMHMGQAGGTAAALAVKSNVTPRELDVKKLQEKLQDEGFYLGDRARLKELGLA